VPMAHTTGCRRQQWAVHSSFQASQTAAAHNSCLMHCSVHHMRHREDGTKKVAPAKRTGCFKSLHIAYTKYT
jgi:hypothetical protein